MALLITLWRYRSLTALSGVLVLVLFLTWSYQSRGSTIEAQRATITSLEQIITTRDIQLRLNKRTIEALEQRAERAAIINTDVTTIIERAAHATPDQDAPIADVLSDALRSVDRMLRQQD